MEATITPLDQITDEGLGCLGEVVAAGNSWGGVDFHRPDGSTTRVIPVDGEWDAGVEIYALSHNSILLGSITYNGEFDLKRIMALVQAIA